MALSLARPGLRATPPVPPAAEASRPAAARLWLCVHLPELALEAAYSPLCKRGVGRDWPGSSHHSGSNPPCPPFAKGGEDARNLLETPAAVWTESAGRPIIHAVNRAAFAQGIQPGLAATAALALCADLRIQPRDEIA